MKDRTPYRLAYIVLVAGLLWACAPRAAAPAGSVAPEPDSPPQPTASGPAPEETASVAPASTSPPAGAVQPSSVPASAPAQPAPPAATASAAATPDEIIHGRSVYARACVMCHGANGAGIPNGPPKLTGLKNLAAVKRSTSAGGANMPPMATLLSAAEIDAVSKFVVAGLPKE